MPAIDQCGAKTRSGGVCRNRPTPGSKRCRMHGGATPKGADSPHFKHGRYSPFAPQHLADKMTAFIDADPLDLLSEMALARAMLANWVETWGDTSAAGAVETTAKLIGEVRSTALAIHKLRADTAITPAEALTFVQRLTEVTMKYIPLELRAAYVSEVASTMGERVTPDLIEGHTVDGDDMR